MACTAMLRERIFLRKRRSEGICTCSALVTEPGQRVLYLCSMDQRVGQKQKYEERRAYKMIIRLMLKDKLEMRKQQQDNMY